LRIFGRIYPLYKWARGLAVLKQGAAVPTFPCFDLAISFQQTGAIRPPTLIPLLRKDRLTMSARTSLGHTFESAGMTCLALSYSEHEFNLLAGV